MQCAWPQRAWYFRLPVVSVSCIGVVPVSSSLLISSVNVPSVRYVRPSFDPFRCPFSVQSRSQPSPASRPFTQGTFTTGYPSKHKPQTKGQKGIQKSEATRYFSVTHHQSFPPTSFVHVCSRPSATSPLRPQTTTPSAPEPAGY